MTHGSASSTDVQIAHSEMYDGRVDVPVSQLRSELRSWLARARGGDEVVITDRGLPVARLVGLPTTDRLEQLTADGLVSRPATPRRRSSQLRRVAASGPVADLVAELRR